MDEFADIDLISKNSTYGSSLTSYKMVIIDLSNKTVTINPDDYKSGTILRVHWKLGEENQGSKLLLKLMTSESKFVNIETGEIIHSRHTLLNCITSIEILKEPK